MIRITRFFCAFLLGLCALCAPFSLVKAEESLPLEITADNALEWNQKDKSYIARGNAVATQGEMSVTADTLTALYAGANGSSSDLTKVIAEGHVLLKSGPDTASGDKAVYDLVAGTVTLDGSRPKITKGTDILEADQVVVYLKDRILERAEAFGTVLITMNGEKRASGDKAVYTKEANIAELIGHAKIMQGTSWIEGDRAEMNLTTKVSKMTGQKDHARVKGIFYPSSGSSPAKKQ